MPVLVFKTCCGCAPLRTGCFIIAYIMLVLYVLNVLVLILIAAKVIAPSEFMDEVENPLGKDQTPMASVTPLALSLVAIAFVIVLLIGLYKRRRNLVLAFLIGLSIVLILNVVTLIFVSAVGSGWVLIVSRVIILVIDIYVLLVIRSYYYKMGADNALDSTSHE